MLYVSQAGRKDIRRLPPMSPCAVTRASGRGTRLARGHLFFCFTRRIQCESMPLGLPAPRWLSSSGIQRSRSGATHWWHHTSHLHPPGHKQAFSGSQTGCPRAEQQLCLSDVLLQLEYAVQYREIKTNVLQAEINKQLQVELSAISLLFSFHILCCLLSFLFLQPLVSTSPLMLWADGPWL